MKKFNDEEVKKIIDMYVETKDIEKMMDVFACEEHDLRVVLKENKVDRRGNRFFRRIVSKNCLFVSARRLLSKGCLL